MAIKFKDTKGAAKKSELDYYKFMDGDNTFRIVGDVCARYVYWIKNREDKKMPVECLSFNRETEIFDNIEKDWVAHYWPNETCSWGYTVQVIDANDNKLKVMGLKKKMFQQILDTAEQIGDPTDIEEGYYITVNRKKTGPKAFNVEYNVKQLLCKPAPLTEAERELIADMKSIDKVVNRQNADEQHDFLVKYFLPEASTDEDAVEELDDEDDDIPF